MVSSPKKKKITMRSPETSRDQQVGDRERKKRGEREIIGMSKQKKTRDRKRVTLLCVRGILLLRWGFFFILIPMEFAPICGS